MAMTDFLPTDQGATEGNTEVDATITAEGVDPSTVGQTEGAVDEPAATADEAAPVEPTVDAGGDEGAVPAEELSGPADEPAVPAAPERVQTIEDVVTFPEGLEASLASQIVVIDGVEYDQRFTTEAELQQARRAAGLE